MALFSDLMKSRTRDCISRLLLTTRRPDPSLRVTVDPGTSDSMEVIAFSSDAITLVSPDSLTSAELVVDDDVPPPVPPPDADDPPPLPKLYFVEPATVNTSWISVTKRITTTVLSRYSQARPRRSVTPLR